MISNAMLLLLKVYSVFTLIKIFNNRVFIMNFIIVFINMNVLSIRLTFINRMF